jgi:hypothetical protein
VQQRFALLRKVWQCKAKEEMMSTLTTAQRLSDPAEQAKLCEAIIEHRGVKRAAEALGLSESMLWVYLARNEEVRKLVWEARAVLAEMLWAECIDIADGPDDPRKAHIRIDTRMRCAGKMLPRIYGEKATTEVNVNTQIGIVCDEATRKRLIDLRDKMLGQRKEGTGQPLARPYDEGTGHGPRPAEFTTSASITPTEIQP